MKGFNSCKEVILMHILMHFVSSVMFSLRRRNFPKIAIRIKGYVKKFIYHIIKTSQILKLNKIQTLCAKKNYSNIFTEIFLNKILSCIKFLPNREFSISIIYVQMQS